MPSPPARDLAEWLRLIRDGWLAFLLVVLIGVSAGLWMTFRQETAYGASGAMVISSRQGFLDPAQADKLPAITGTVVRLAELSAVLDASRRTYVRLSATSSARAERERTADLTWLRSHLEARQVANSSLIELESTARTRRDAIDLARAFVTSLAAAANDVGPSGTPGGTQEQGIEARVFSEAEPRGQVSPTPVRNVLIGGNVGFLLGVVVAALVGIGRGRLHRSEEVSEALGIPVVAELRLPRRRRSADIPALVNLGARLLMTETGSSSQIVLLTGTTNSRSIGRLAERLTEALSAVSKTALLDADTHRSGSTLNEGQAASEDGASGTGRAEHVNADWFRPGEAALAERLKSLAGHNEIVIVAGPPFGRSRELVQLLRLADRILFVVDRGAAERDVVAAAALGEGFERRLLGAVVLG